MTHLRLWSLPISLLLHGLIMVALLLASSHPAPPPALPQIQLLPLAALPPHPREAMPSPTAATIRPEPSPQTAASTRPAPDSLRPLTAANARTDAVTPKRPHPLRPAAHPQPVERITAEQPAPTISEAAALAISGVKSDTASILTQDAATAIPAGPPPDYVGLIRAKLERAKRYPSQARSQGQEGTVALRFTLDRSGQLLAWTIKRASGVAALDREAGEMLQRAAPFPPFPDSLERDQMNLVVPVEFSLRTP